MQRLITKCLFLLCLLPSLCSSQTISKVTYGSGGPLTGVFFISPDTGWVTEVLGGIRKTTDGGATWLQQFFDTKYVGSDRIKFANKNKGWVLASANGSSRILKTNNGGAIWDSIAYFPTVFFADIDFTDSLNGWAAGYDSNTSNGVIYKTADGGLHWQLQSTNLTGAGFGDIEFTDSLHGWISTYTKKLYKTDNAGKTWSVINLNFSDILSRITFSDTLNGWAAVGNEKIYYTHNGGKAWNYYSLPNQGFNLTSVYFLDSLHGLVSGVASSIFYTKDGGKNWKRIHFAGNLLTSIHFVDINTAWITGDWGDLFRFSSLGLDKVQGNLCKGDSLKINVNQVGHFNPGNIFTVQLADTAGSFNSPINIGSKADTANTTISCRFPLNTINHKYKLRVISSNPKNTGGDNDFDIGVGSINVTVGRDTIMDASDTLQLLTNSDYIGNSILNYKWTPFSYLSFDTIPNPISIPLADITYTAWVYSSNDSACFGNDSMRITVLNSGITQHLSSAISIFPNPFSSQTTIKMDKPPKNAILTVYNVVGQQVKQIKNISEQSLILHRDNLVRGVYFIQVEENSKLILSDKLIITDN